LERLGIMTDLADPGPAAVTARPPRSYVLDIVIPVYNEERDLPCAPRLVAETAVRSNFSRFRRSGRSFDEAGMA
jgi:hypothetical protein